MTGWKKNHFESMYISYQKMVIFSIVMLIFRSVRIQLSDGVFSFFWMDFAPGVMFFSGSASRFGQFGVGREEELTKSEDGSEKLHRSSIIQMTYCG